MLGLFGALSFGGWLIHRREPHEVLRRSMRRMTKQINTFQIVIGEAFIPVVQDMAEAVRKLNEALS